MLFGVTIELSRHSTENQIRQFAREHGCTASIFNADDNTYLFTSPSYDCLEELAMQVLDDDVSEIIFNIPKK